MTEPSDRDLARRAALDRYWDAIVDGQLAMPEDDLDTRQAAIVRRVHVLAGETVADTDRAEQLWRDLMSGYTQTVPLQLTPAMPRPMNGHHRFRHTGAIPGPAFTPSARRRRLLTGLSFVTTVALIAAILAVLFSAYRHQQRVAVPPVQETAASDVSMYRGNPARTGEMPGPAPEGTPVERWRVAIDGSNSAPAVVDGTLYIGSTDGVFSALDATTGTEQWSFRQATAAYYSPTVVDGIVYVGNDDLNVYAIDAVTGEELWRFTTTGAVTLSPLVIDGTVYLGGDDNSLYALDAKTGQERWRATLGGPPARSAAYADGTVFIGSRDGALNALDAKTGTQKWRAQTDNVDGTMGTPAVAGETVVQVAFDGPVPTALHAFDIETGAARWTFSPPEQVVAAVAVADNTVFVGSSGGVFFAIDAETGTERWRFTTEDFIDSAAAVVGPLVYVMSHDGNLYALNAATGAEEWRMAVGTGASFGPVVVNGIMYVSGLDGQIHALGEGRSGTDGAATPGSALTTATSVTTPESEEIVEFVWSTSGSELGQFTTPIGARVSPDGKLWVGDASGRFFIFDLDGNLLEIWGEGGSLPGQFRFVVPQDREMGICWADDGSFYVADSYNQRIQHFDRDRNLIGIFGSQGNEDGQFQAPSSIAIDASGNLVVADLARDDVQWFAPDGTFLRRFTGEGTTSGQLIAPIAIALAGDDSFWVAEVDAGRVRHIDQNGQEIGALEFDDASSQGPIFPVDLAIDDRGFIFVAQERRHVVQVFDSSGQFVFEWGAYGTGDGQFDGPGWVAVNRGGTSYVVDINNARIQKFKQIAPFPPPVEESPTP